MNVRYRGTRMNKRQLRGSVTGKRYSYSFGQPIFTINPEDKLQFQGEVEDGRPKFQFEDDPDDTVLYVLNGGTLEDVTIDGLKDYLTETDATREQLELLLDIETKGHNRVGARRIIEAALNETHAQGIEQLQRECGHQRLTDGGTSCIECGADILDLAKMTIAQIEDFLMDNQLQKEGLRQLFIEEETVGNRKGALAAIQRAINELP